MRLCLPVVGPSLSLVKEQLARIAQLNVVAELRVDLLEDFELSDFKKLLPLFENPLILTLRSEAQGGGFQGDAHERHERLCQLAGMMQPQMIDVELGTSKQELKSVRLAAPEAKIVVSFHDFDRTPEHLGPLLDKMRELSGDIYKIATMSHSSVDALRMLNFCWRAQQRGVCVWGQVMGEDGAPSRLLAGTVGSPFVFSTLDQASASAPGQLDYAAMIARYRADQQTPKTMRLGLLGDPVSKSIGPPVHNRVLSLLGLDGVYVGLRTEPAQLAEVLAELKTLGWRGLSVTMPLKEAVLQHLDEIDPDAQAIGAVNTIVFNNGSLKGYNTDGMGAVGALKAQLGSLKDLRAIVLGAGGTAKSVAYRLMKEGVHVTMVNRTLSRAERVAEQLGVHAAPLETLAHRLKEAPEVVINTTSVGMAPHVDATLVYTKDLLPQTLVFDVVASPRETRLLAEAKRAGCPVLEGRDLWVHQAIPQLQLWYGENLHSENLLKDLERAIDGYEQCQRTV